MNRGFFAALTLLVTFTVATAQQSSDETEFSLKNKVELVVMQAVVTDHGNTVPGLKKEDFALFSDGKAEKIAVFEEVDAVPAKPGELNLPPHTVQNYQPADSHQDVVIVLLDFLNAGFTTSFRIRSSLKEIARQLAETHTPVTVLMLTASGLVQLQSFTSDPENLTKAVEKWQSQVPAQAQINPNEVVAPSNGIPDWASPISRTDITAATGALQHFATNLSTVEAAKLDTAVMTLQAIEQIAGTFHGIPGRKKLLWLSTGFPTTIEDSGPFKNNRSFKSALSAQTEFNIREKTTRAWRALSNANIAVYPIDSNGVTNPEMEDHVSAEHDPWGNRFGADRETKSNTSSLLEVAEKTGGQNCTLDPAPCVKLAQADASHYYVVGFYLKNNSKAGWHKLKLNVDQPHVSVRARDGFWVGDDPKANKEFDVTNDVIVTALASPLDYTSIPLRLHWSKLSMQGKDTQIELALNSPPGGIAVDPQDGTLNTNFLAFIRPVGKTEGHTIPATLASKLSHEQQESLAATGFLYRKQVLLPPDRYEVRVLMRDNVAKKMGTVSTIIDLTDSTKP